MSNKSYKVKDRLNAQQIFTIPNILSFLRIALIPVIVYFYLFAESTLWTIITLAVSGLTDIVDGWIARRFNMISDFGKAIDPLADKMTQIAVLICLVIKFPLMLIPVIIMLIKEIGSLIFRFIVFKKTNQVEGAVWHGKLTTTLVYSTMVLHILWPTILPAITIVCVVSTSAMLVLSCVLYAIAGAKIIIDYNKAHAADK